MVSVPDTQPIKFHVRYSRCQWFYSVYIVWLWITHVLLNNWVEKNASLLRHGHSVTVPLEVRHSVHLQMDVYAQQRERGLLIREHIVHWILVIKTEETVHSKFLGLHLDNHLDWKDHIDQMIPELSGACYAVRSMFHISNINTLKSIYCAYFHSIIQYGIILGEILPTAGRYLHYKRKSSELWLVHILDLHVEIYLKN
jgi:hypothetical protein